MVKDVNIQLDEFGDNSSVGYVTFQPPIEENRDQPLTKNWARSSFTIETKRAGLIPLQYMNDPKASRIAVDVRILDEDGNPVFTQISGHSPTDPTWLPYEPIGSTNTDDLADKSQKVFAALPSVLPLYAEKLKSLGLDPEQQALSNLQRLTQYSLANESIDSHDKAASSSLVTQTIEIWRGPVLYGYISADHTATLLKATSSSGSVINLWSVCNMHGSANGCPGSQGMSKKCSKSFSNRRPSTPAFNTECNTPYGITKGYHVCNDDTYVQYQSVKANSQANMATCSDSTLRRYAPTCD